MAVEREEEEEKQNKTKQNLLLLTNSYVGWLASLLMQILFSLLHFLFGPANTSFICFYKSSPDTGVFSLPKRAA